MRRRSRKQFPVFSFQRMDRSVCSLMVVALCFLFFSCNTKSAKKPGQAAVNSSPVHKTPKPIYFTDPVPSKIAVPTVLHSGVPISKPADFFVSMQNYNTDQGLALSSVRSACMDHSGKIWLGTLGGGVCRFDGKSFTNFTTREGLANNDVYNCVMEDKSGNVWFGTYGGGASRYDGKSFKTFNTKNGLPSNVVFSILEDKQGIIWFATLGGGVSRYDGKSFVTITTKEGLVSDSVLSICEDKKGHLWFGTNGGGLSRYTPKKSGQQKTFTASPSDFVNYTTQQGLTNNRIYTIAEDCEGNIWIGTDGGGVNTCHPQEGTSMLEFTNFTTKDGLANNSVLSILEDKTGMIWFATDGGGVSRYGPDSHFVNNGKGPRGRVFTNFSVAEGLPNNQVFCITEDKNGNLYFGTGGGGLSRYDGKAFTSFSTKEGLANNTVFGICEDSKGDFWFGTYEGGASRYDGKSFTTYSLKEGLPNSEVNCIFEDKNKNMWFCTYGGGISRFDGKTFSNYSTRNGLVNNTVTCGLQDTDGNYWFGTTGGGVSRFDGSRFTNYSTKQGLAGNNVISMLQDRSGRLWFCTLGGGVSRFDPHAKQHCFVNFSTKDGLPVNGVSSVMEDQSGNFWFGTYGGGVCRYDGETFVNYTATDGLSDDVVYAIVEDKNAMIWFGTNAGFTGLKGFRDVMVNKREEHKKNEYLVAAANKIPGSQLGHYYKPVFEQYNQKNGYPIKDINTNAMYCDRQGIIWAGTGDRLVRFDYGGVRKTNYSPQVILQSVKVQGENICWYDLLRIKGGPIAADTVPTPNIAEEVFLFGHILSAEKRDSMISDFGDIRFDSITPFYPIPTNLVLPYNHNNITIDFTAIETARPSLVRYRYKLKGYDKEWSPPAEKSSASFGNIGEGEYTFFLKARSPDGIWGNPVSFSFRVLPPWYRTWWAYLLEILAFLAVIAVVFRLRTMALLEDKVKLEQTVKERTGHIEKQRQIIEEKNERITESISYAKHIQDSMLQSEEELRKHLPEMFIYSRPKDIVSGDFYWFSEQDNKIIVAVADCTGHGVPGAFMTVIGTMLLNEIVIDKAIKQPGLILGELHKGIDKLLKQQEATTQAQDGMDISLCVIDKATHSLEFAGAKNSLYIIQDGELIVIKADAQGVGGKTAGEDLQEKVFITQTLATQKGMQLYMFTDGYRDQFSAKDKVKFGSARFRDLLLSISKTGLPERKVMLHNHLEE